MSSSTNAYYALKNVGANCVRTQTTMFIDNLWTTTGRPVFYIRDIINNFI